MILQRMEVLINTFWQINIVAPTPLKTACVSGLGHVTSHTPTCR